MQDRWIHVRYHEQAVKTPRQNGILGFLTLLSALSAPADVKRLSKPANYQKYIDPLL
jgi:hypothetical protein